MLKSIKNFFLSRFFVKNLFLAFIMLAVLIFLIFIILSLLTRHNKTIKVPDFRGLELDQVDNILDKVKLRYEIKDTVYDYALKPNVVYSHVPKPFSDVKKNRKIYISIVSNKRRIVKLPELRDLTYSVAKEKIELLNLIAGDTIYVPDMADNTVLDIQVDGNSVSVGFELPEMSVVDFIVGNGEKGEKILIPNLIGDSYVLASEKLKRELLRFHVHYDTSFNINILYVVNQHPLYNGKSRIKQGRYIDLYLDTSIVLLDSLELDFKPFE